MDQISVTVVKFGDRPHLQMQYVDPIMRGKTRSTGCTTKAQSRVRWPSGNPTSRRALPCAVSRDVAGIPRPLRGGSATELGHQDGR